MEHKPAVPAFIPAQAAFKVLADVQRLHILWLLQQGETPAEALLDRLEIGQPTFSHHMKVLLTARLVQVRRQGKRAYYRLHPQGTAETAALLQPWLSPVLPTEEPAQHEAAFPQTVACAAATAAAPAAAPKASHAENSGMPLHLL